MMYTHTIRWVFVCISSMGALRAETFDTLMMGLVSNHNLVFGKENLFFKPLEPQEWYRYLDEATRFVTDNAYNDAHLLTAHTTIYAANDTLINGIKVAYTTLFGPCGSYQESIAHDTLVRFKESIAVLQSLQASLEQEQYMYAGKKEVCQLLSRLAFFVEVTTQKAMNDFLKCLIEVLEKNTNDLNEYL